MQQEPRPPVDLLGVGALALGHLALHLAALPGYGYFRDELYYLACARRLAWGYVDHPPLSIALLRLQTALLGDSAAAVHVLPALVGAACVAVAGLLARELGGGRNAQRLTAAAVFAAPFLSAVSHFYSMNVFDWLLWSLLWWTAARLLGGGDARGWLLFGALAGLALLDKLQVVALAGGLVLGLLATRERVHLTRPWIWAGGAIAFLIFLPHLLWQVQNGWPTLEFIARAKAEKIHAAGPVEQLLGQALLVGPLAAPLWLLGLAALLGGAAFARFRALGWAFLAVVVLFTVQGAKVYYATPAYPVPLAAGAVALEGWLAARRIRWGMAAATAVLVVAALAVAPMTVPLLSPEAVAAYAARLGIQEPQTENRERNELPTIFADSFGWTELVDRLAAIWDALPEADRKDAVVLTRNYGQAGAVEQLGPARGLPPAVSGHNNYWLWGPGPYRGGTLISVGFTREELEPWFDEVEAAGVTECRWCLPGERGQPIFVCRGLRGSVAELWPRLRRFI